MSQYPWLKTTFERISDDAAADRLAHALLLSGNEGIGVQEFATEIAAYRLCFNTATQNSTSQDNQSQTNCGQCKACALLKSGTHPDLKVLEPEGAAQIIKVDQVRELINFLSQTPQIGEWKVAVIRPAHRMNHNAANALLKALEEPPGRSLLLLATELPQILLPTVRSRCTHIRLPNPNELQTRDYLSSIDIDGAALSEAMDTLGFKPLLIAKWMNTDLMASWKQVSTEIDALETKRTSAVKVAAVLKDIDIVLLISWLTEKAAARMKASLLSRHKAPVNLHVFECYERVYSLLIETRRTLDSGTNPNAQLTLESILLDWPVRDN